jgi:hypothetical protein
MKPQTQTVPKTSNIQGFETLLFNKSSAPTPALAQTNNVEPISAALLVVFVADFADFADLVKAPALL